MREESIDVMIDAGQAWDLKGALHMAAVYERYSVAWLEEPLHIMMAAPAKPTV